LVFASERHWREEAGRVHLYEQGGHGFGMGTKETTSTGWFEAFANWLRMHGFVQSPRP
jgi:hypothetical protein